MLQVFTILCVKLVPGELLFKMLDSKRHLINAHLLCEDTGIRLHRATLKKANTSIASFLDSQLVFQ